MENNKGICLISPKPSDSGGISRWCSIYTSFLTNQGLKCFLLDTTPTISIASRKNVIKRIFSSLPLMRRICNELKKLIKENKIFCVHIASCASLSLFRDKKIIKICKNHNIPVIYHYHFGTFDKIFKKQNFEYKMLKKNSLSSYKTICIDENTYNLAKSEISNLVLIHNPVEVKNNNKNLRDKKILFAGHVRENKGINELVAAWDILKNKNKDWELIICGDLFFEYEEKAKNPENLNNRIKYTGHVQFDELQGLMDSASIFILPSYFEGCPNVILEAMSHGMAVIGTNVGAIPELLNGCGTVIKSHSVDDIVTSIQDYIDDSQKVLNDGRCAFEKIASEYSTSVVCSKYIELLKEINR